MLCLGEAVIADFKWLVSEAELRRRGVAIEDVETKIAVVNRGSWGELRFSSRD